MSKSSDSDRESSDQRSQIGEPHESESVWERAARRIGRPAKTQDQLIAELANSLPISGILSDVTKVCLSIIDPVIAATTNELTKADEQRVPARVNVAKRKLRELSEARETALKLLTSEEYAKKLAQQWRELVNQHFCSTDDQDGVSVSPNEQQVMQRSEFNHLNQETIAEIVQRTLDEELNGYLQVIRSRGGRRPKWDNLWRVAQELSNLSDAEIVAKYNQRYPRGPKAKVKNLQRARYDRTKRKKK